MERQEFRLICKGTEGEGDTISSIDARELQHKFHHMENVFLSLELEGFSSFACTFLEYRLFKPRSCSANLLTFGLNRRKTLARS